jgi:hypothetical protein
MANLLFEERERDRLGLSWRQRHALEGLELFHGLQDAGAVLVHAELHDVVAATGPVLVMFVLTVSGPFAGTLVDDSCGLDSADHVSYSIRHFPSFSDITPTVAIRRCAGRVNQASHRLTGDGCCTRCAAEASSGRLRQNSWLRASGHLSAATEPVT